MKLINKILWIIIIFLLICLVIKKINLIKYNNENKANIKQYISFTSSNTLSSKPEINLYDAVLEVKSLNLKQGIVKYKNSNIDKNVVYLYPEKINNLSSQNLVIAAHSGNTSLSFFHNLNKLKEDEKVNIYFKGNKYIYEIISIKEKDKDGIINIEHQDNSKLYLTTCSENDESKQLIVIANLKNVESY